METLCFCEILRAKLAKLEEEHPCKEVKYRRLLSMPSLLGGVKKCGYIDQLYYNGEDEYE